MAILREKIKKKSLNNFYLRKYRYRVQEKILTKLFIYVKITIIVVKGLCVIFFDTKCQFDNDVISKLT